MTGISVIICCYNSAARLPATLRHIAAQRTAGFEWEVVVVDNSSTDGTTEVACQEWQRYGLAVPFRVVPESRPGLVFAREKGLASIRYELILFCDDDNWLDENYISTACALMQDETIGVLGGLSLPVADVALPAWFDTFGYAYACGPQADQDGNVSADRLFIAGAGMVTRRKIYRQLADSHFTSQLTGRTGADLSSGEDTEFSIVAALLGYRLVYSSQLVLQHYMDAKRLKWAYFLKLAKGHAQSGYKIDLYKQLYRKGEINPSWFAYFQSSSNVRDSIYLLRRALRWWGMSARKSQLRVGDVAAVEAFTNVEIWKMHLRFRREYPIFVADLNDLGRRLRYYQVIASTATT